MLALLCFVVISCSNSFVKMNKSFSESFGSFNERNEQIDLENLVPKIKDFSNCVFSQKEIILIFKVSKNSNWTILIFYWNIAVFIVNDLTVQSLFFLHALNRRKKKQL